MKTDILLGWVFGFVVYSAVILTIHEFLQFWLAKRLKPILTKEIRHPLRGKYFHRFVPLDLKNEFAQKEEDYSKQINPRHSRSRYIITTLLTLIYLVGIGAFLNKRMYKLYNPIDLSVGEKRDLNLSTGLWKDKPIKNKKFKAENTELREPATDLQRSYVLIKNSEAKLLQLKNMKDYVSESQRNWINWFEKNKRRHKVCEWERLNNCQLSVKNHVVVALPGFWQAPVLKGLLDKGHSILLYGAPLNLFLKQDRVNLFNIEFRSFKQDPQDYSPLRIVGDQRLTIGVDAGFYIQAPASKNFFDYAVTAPNSEAISMSSELTSLANKGDRLLSQVHDKGRLVWTDIPYTNVEESLNSHSNVMIDKIFENIEKFLSHQTYTAFATWPQGKTFATIIEQDTEDKFENSKNVLPLFEKHKVPVTWFIVSELAEKHRHLTRQMASVGEVACHGDNHDVFPNSSLYGQVYKLAKCKKTLAEITNHKILGFRPPEEKYNNDTFDSVANNEMSYIFSESYGTQAVPRILKNVKTKKEIVSIGRINKDDYYLWGVKNFPSEQSKSVLKEDLDTIERLGGLFTFSFHTQFMNSSDRLDVLETLIIDLKTRNTFFATAKDIALWWKLKNQLESKASVNGIDIEKFRPQVLTVKSDGLLVKSEYQQ